MSNEKSDKPAKSEQQMMAETMAEAIQKGITDGIAMSKMAELEAAAKLRDKAKEGQNYTKCPKCGQRVKACGGPVADAKTGKIDLKAEDKNHVKMVVLPEDPEDIKFFQGIRVNGKNYLSNNHKHFLLVPRKNNFAWILHNYVRNEKDMRRGRKATHNSGSIGGRSATGFQQASRGWR